MSFPYFAFAFVFLALYVNQGEGIHCYICSSDADRRCGDHFNATKLRYMIEDCDRGKSPSAYLRSTALCRKVKQTTNGETIIVRSCYWPGEHDSDGPCSANSVNPRTKIEMCTTCDTDECNAASSVLPTLIFLPIALFVPRLLIK